MVIKPCAAGEKISLSACKMLILQWENCSNTTTFEKNAPAAAQSHLHQCRNLWYQLLYQIYCKHRRRRRRFFFTIIYGVFRKFENFVNFTIIYGAIYTSKTL